jgi:O-antigen/teichoic acid export membrane protein
MKENIFQRELNLSLEALAKSSIIVFFGLIVSKIFTFLYKAIIARNFSPWEYGHFSIAIIVAGWFIALSSLGLPSGLLRFISLYRGQKNQNKINYLFKISLWIVVASGVISAVSMFFLSRFLAIHIFNDPSLLIFFQVFSILVPLVILFDFFMSYIQSYERITAYSVIYNIISSMLPTIFLVLFLFIQFKKHAIGISYILGFLIPLIISYVYIRHKIKESFGKFTLRKQAKSKIIRELFSYSTPLIFISLIYTILGSIDTILLAHFKTATEVGLYNAAMPLALLFGVTPALFLKLLFPLIVRNYSQRNLNLIREIVKQAGIWIFIINLPALIIMFLFPGAIIKLIFGSSYLAAAPALKILLIGSFFSSLFLTSYYLINMVGKSKLLFIDVLIAVIINFVLNYILIPLPKILFLDNSRGITGAAISYTLSFVLLGALYIFQAKKLTSIFPLRRKVVRILILSFIPTLVLVILKNIIPHNILSLILLVLFFILSYFFIIFFFGGFSEKDLILLKIVKNDMFGYKTKIKGAILFVFSRFVNK